MASDNITIDFGDVIRDFCHNKEHQDECLALIVNGAERGDDMHKIISRVMANVLLRFHKIEIGVTGNN